MSDVIKKHIETKLSAAFSPDKLEVINESKHHVGHRRDDGESYDGDGETHFRIIIAAKMFNNMKKIDSHRAIHHVLEYELTHGVHALAIEIKEKE